jgi:hypothetical protein
MKFRINSRVRNFSGDDFVDLFYVSDFAVGL